MSTAPIGPGELGGVAPAEPARAPDPALRVDTQAPIRPVRPTIEQPRTPPRKSAIRDDDIGKTATEEAVEGGEDVTSSTSKPLPAAYIRAMAREAMALKRLADWLSQQSLTDGTKKSALAVIKDLALAHALVCAGHLSEVSGDE
jgi:hypothetical protein